MDLNFVRRGPSKIWLMDQNLSQPLCHLNSERSLSCLFINDFFRNAEFWVLWQNMSNNSTNTTLKIYVFKLSITC